MFDQKFLMGGMRQHSYEWLTGKTHGHAKVNRARSDLLKAKLADMGLERISAGTAEQIIEIKTWMDARQ